MNITGSAWSTLRLVRFSVLLIALLILLPCYSTSPTLAHVPSPIAVGQNGTETGSGRSITWTQTGPGEGHWTMDDPIKPQYLIADPTAPPMSKRFLTPRDSESNDQFLNLQPGWTSPVWEYYFASDGTGPLGRDIPVSLPITDWHEHILEPGWEWVVPSPESSDPALITNDGLPWDWEFIDAEPTSIATWLSVQFAAIEPGVPFVIHKQLRWSGTSENSVWGDRMLDDGSTYLEGYISVIEYPSVVPEPTTTSLALAATLFFVGRRRI